MDEIKMVVKSEKELEILIRTVSIYNEDIIMEFVREKCAMLIIRRGK